MRQQQHNNKTTNLHVQITHKNYAAQFEVSTDVLCVLCVFPATTGNDMILQLSYMEHRFYLHGCVTS